MLSSSYRNRLARAMPEEEEAPPPPPPYDYLVSGTLNPDATGEYSDAGIHNGQPYYARDPNTYFLWWWPADSWWVISTALDNVGRPGCWHSAAILGIYTPAWSYTGDATVTAP